MRWLMIVTLLILSPAVPAETASACSAPAYRAWDFWVGEWEVHSQSGQFQGTNVITRQEQGCLLVESWTSAQGGTGQSYNFYHPAQDAWHQLWVSSGAIIDYAGNVNDTGAMLLEGTITYRADGRQARFMGRWSPGENGTVLQELSEWDDEKAHWRPWFTGIYTPANSTGTESAERAPEPPADVTIEP